MAFTFEDNLFGNQRGLLWSMYCPACIRSRQWSTGFPDDWHRTVLWSGSRWSHPCLAQGSHSQLIPMTTTWKPLLLNLAQRRGGAENNNPYLFSASLRLCVSFFFPRPSRATSGRPSRRAISPTQRAELGSYERDTCWACSEEPRNTRNTRKEISSVCSVYSVVKRKEVVL